MSTVTEVFDVITASLWAENLCSAHFSYRTIMNTAYAVF